VRPWYETAFGRDYLALYPHRDDEEAARDVAAIVALVDPPRDEPLLDLGCGAGRHLIALAGAGFTRLVGLDLSEELLEVARTRIEEAGVGPVDLVRGDMRAIPYADRFATALSLFTSFGYFTRDEENAKVLRSVGEALRPGGWFLVDTLSRDATIADLVPEEELRRGDTTIRIRRAISDDGLRVDKETRVVGGGSTEQRIYRESVRMYAPEELIGMFRQAGFSELRTHGSLRGEPHGAGSRRLVVVGRRPIR